MNAKVLLCGRFRNFSVNKKLYYGYVYHRGKCLWMSKRIQQQNWGFLSRVWGDQLLSHESSSSSTETQNYMEPYAEEPLADEEWLQNYRKEQEDKEYLERKLKLRIDNAVPVSDWWVCFHSYHIVVFYTATRKLHPVFVLGVPLFSVAVIYLEILAHVISFVKTSPAEGEELRCLRASWL